MTRKRAENEAGGKSPPKAKDVRFREQAPRRVKQAVYRLNRVRNLANRGSYQYTEAQVAWILDTLGDAYQSIGHAFARVEPEHNGITDMPQ